ncbi:MAG: hypothetical protein ACR2LN_07120 [Candidatus Levyibacteriota bacterium]
MNKEDPKRYTTEQIRKIVSAGDPKTARDVRSAETVLRKIAADPKAATATELLRFPALQKEELIVAFEELDNKTPVDALWTAIQHEGEGESEVTVFSAEPMRSRTPVADKYLHTTWYEDKLQQVARERRTEAALKRRRKKTPQEQQERREVDRKKKKKVAPLPHPLPPSNLTKIQLLQVDSGVSAKTLRKILGETDKVRIGQFLYVDNDQATSRIESYKREKAKSKEKPTTKKQLSEGSTTAFILSKQLNISKSTIRIVLMSLRERDGNRYTYPEAESIKILTQWKANLERKKRLAQAKKNTPRPVVPQGYIKNIDLAEQFKLTPRQTAARLRSLQGATVGRKLYFPKDQALLMLNKKQQKKTTQLEERSTLEKSKRPEGKPLSYFTKRYGLDHNKVSQILKDASYTKWGNAHLYDETIACGLIEKYLPQDEHIYVRETKEHVAYPYFIKKYGISYFILDKELAEIDRASEPGVGGVALVPLSESFVRLSKHIHAPRPDKETGIYTDNDNVQWTTRFVFKKQYGISYEIFAKFSGELPTTHVRTRNGQILPAYKISDVAVLYASYLQRHTKEK